ncbi:malto-oligosyltrehalose trehalohydrolase [Sinomonas sp. ASV486]|uniref:malto-oligosyltrehalose trehalohydrolase n=1 Tax=Sinomonas sp. ASV486 TaxID=3051170 RepID=UPI0027DD5392|nr:malto-oligosyltrehalose trehalohydrolase [Sinomonas sp. ASV486]MDQ4488856.1 malto-oligosyltrehalose trehalohydrolase [Sinomonas sp. ASV486]
MGDEVAPVGRRQAESKPLGAVWAPIPSRVDLVLGAGPGAEHLRLEEADGGWWSPPSSEAGRVAAALADGARYGFVLDAEGPFPDPRSRRQPEGVHALSAGFDAGRHAWADEGWTGRDLAGAVVYELHVGTFTQAGTLDAAAERLAYLADLGVGFVELMPVNAFNGPRNWGYDGVLWYAVHEGYSGPAAYERFVDAAHAAGIAVIQDVVYNHFGPSGNYQPKFGPYLLAGASTGWGDAVNLDGADSDEVRSFILDNARMWLDDYRVDGLRLDAVHAFLDRRALTLLEELQLVAEDVERTTGRRKVLIAESDLNDPRIVSARAVGGYGLAGQWTDDVHHAVHVALTGETGGYYADFAAPGALAKVIRGGYFHDGTLSSFRGRCHGRPLDPARVRPSQLVVSCQNHDQVGNRAAGDRPSAVLDWDGLAVAAVLILASPFTPMLFMGEEYGATTPWQFFTSHPEPELAAATAEGRLAEFEEMGWDPFDVPDPQDPATFERSVLDWTQARTHDGARLLALYRRLIEVRAELPGLWSGRLDETDVIEGEAAGARWISWRRPGAIVCVGFGPGPVDVPLPPGFAGRAVAATDPACAVVTGASGEAVRLPGLAAVVLSA